MAGINRPMSQMRKLEAKETLFRARKRILKYLVLEFLRQEGLVRSAEVFSSEAGLTDEYRLCDNVDLDIILQDYCSYYLIRFNKQPQFCKKVEERPPSRRPQTRRTRPEPVEREASPPAGQDLPSTFTVTKLLKDNLYQNAATPIPAIDTKPLAGFVAHTSAEREIVELVYGSIVRSSAVAWDDVKGLDEAKRILMESIVYPVRYPTLFTGLLEPWHGLLLHGPPGSGKTMLARAVAGAGGCVFFNITATTLVTKWRGESEKIVKVLFDMASYYSPSVVFLDEGDAVAGRREEGHEASRRLCSQLIAELDGVSRRDGIVFLLVNSNMPWNIDPAILRRLEKRIFIPLPDFNTRVQLFKAYLTCENIEVVPKVDFEDLARRTEGYSGSDIKLACKEALMAGVRKMLTTMGGKNQNNRIERISLADVLLAIEKTKPVSKDLSRRHEEWQKQMGST